MARQTHRILLVESDGVLAEVTAFRLELLGFSVETVATTDEALRAVTQAPPDLIITDLNLDGSNATGLIELLNRQVGTNDIPVMVLSVDADLDRVAAVHQVGASEFLVVPFQPEVLQEKVAKLLARSPRIADEKDKVKAATW